MQGVRGSSPLQQPHTNHETQHQDYCLLHSTFPTPLFHTQVHLIFEVLYLTQFMMDSLKFWTVHSPICHLDVWLIILPNIILFSIHVFGFLGWFFVNQTALENAEHHRLPWYCACTNFSTISICSRIFVLFSQHLIEWKLLNSAWVHIWKVIIMLIATVFIQ